MNTKRSVSLLSLLALGIMGCGGGAKFAKPVGVSGSVKLGGKPVEGATVTFLSKEGTGRSASGKTNTQGEFKLTTFSTDDGAIPGEYTVTIAKADAAPAADDIDVEGDADPGEMYGKMMDAAGTGNLGKVQETSLPAKYASAEQSGLVRTVGDQAGQNVFGFDLE